MRIVMLGIFTCFAIVAMQSTASAQQKMSCSQRAALCIPAGGTQATCYEPTRMAQCRATKQYTSPSGRVWPAELG